MQKKSVCLSSILMDNYYKNSEYSYMKYSLFFSYKYVKFSPSTQSRTSDSVTPDENLLPSSQLPVPASFLRSSPLSPKPELDEVQNGITVLPLKSKLSKKVKTAIGIVLQ